MPALAVNYGSALDDLRVAAIDFSGSGDTAIVAGGPGILRIWMMLLAVAGATSITFKAGTTVLSGAVPLITGVPLVLPFSTKPWFRCGAGNAFQINSSNSVQCSGTVYYT